MSYDSPAVILYDGYGNPVTIDGYHVSVYPKASGLGGYPPNPSLTYPDGYYGEKYPLSVDPRGGLATRGQVLTDEGSYYDDFDGSDLGSDWDVFNYTCNYSVSNSVLKIGAGQTPGGVIIISHAGDILPISVTTKMRISNRNPGSLMSFGFQTDPALFDFKRVALAFDGSNEKLFNYASYSTETSVKYTQIEAPDDYKVSDYHYYTIEVGNGYTAAYLDGKKIIYDTDKCPGPYDNLRFAFFITNIAPITSDGYMYIENISINNNNVLEISNSFSGKPLNVDIQPNTSVLIQGADESKIQVDHDGSNSTLFVSDFNAVTTLNRIVVLLERIEGHLSLMNDLEPGEIDE